MKLNILETLTHALSVGNWLQNVVFYFILLLMTQVVLFQSKLTASRLRSGLADKDFE